MKKKLIIIAVCLFGIDIVSKCIALKYLEVNQSVTLIPHFFSLTLSKNTGGAFSILSGNVVLIIILSIVVIYFLIGIIRDGAHNSFEMICYSLICGGAVGNLFDRVVYGYVVDFLDFNILGYDYPIFNFADSFIVIGVICLAIDGFKRKG